MRQYEKYIDTGYKFLPKLPANWELKLGLSCFEENKRKNSDLTERLLLQFCYGSIIHKANQEIKEADEAVFAKYTIVEPNDIMLNGLNLNYDFVSQRVGIVKEKGTITSAYLALRCRKHYNPFYANYLLKALDAQKVFHGMGSGIRLTLGYSEFSRIQFPVPPKDEQDQIVRYLDWKVSHINRLIHGHQRQIDLLEERKRSFTFNAVTQGLQVDLVKTESPLYWLESVPAHWDTNSIAQLFNEVKNKNKGMQENNLLSLSYGAIKRRNINATEGLLPASFEGYNIIEKDDIVLRLTDLQNDHKSLRTGIATERGIITSAYLTIRNKSDNNPEFLQLFLHAFDLAKGFYNVGASGVRQSLNLETVKTLKVLIPPVTEQNQIVEAIKAEYKKIENAKPVLEKQINLLREYRNRLISDVVTGQVDVRGVEIPDYTPEEDNAAYDENNDTEEVTDNAD